MPQDPLDAISQKYLTPASPGPQADPLDAISAKYLPASQPADDLSDVIVGGAPLGQGERGEIGGAPPPDMSDPQVRWSLEHPYQSALASGLYNAGQVMSFGLGKRFAALQPGRTVENIEHQMGAAHEGARSGGFGSRLLEAGVGATGLVGPGGMAKKLVPAAAGLPRAMATTAAVFGGQRGVQGLVEGEGPMEALKAAGKTGAVAAALPLVGKGIGVPLTKAGIPPRLAGPLGGAAAFGAYGAATAEPGDRGMTAAVDALVGLGVGTIPSLAGRRAPTSAERLFKVAKSAEKGRQTRYGSLWVTPQYSNLRKSAPEVFEAATRAASVRNAAESIGELQGKEMKALLKTPAQHEAFMRQMISDQAWGLKQQGRTPKDFLSMPGERKIFDDALKLYDQHNAKVAEHTPDVDTGLSPKARRPVPEGSRYMHLSRVSTTQAKRLADLARIAKAEGRETVLSEPGVADTSAHPSGVGGPISKRGLFKKMGAAKKASGEGEAYSLDYTDVRKSAIADQLHAATHNRLRDAIRKYAYPEAEGTQRPLEVEFGGKREPLVPVDLGKDPLWRSQALSETGELPTAKPAENVYVPKSVAQAWQDHIIPPEALKLPGGLSKVASAGTRIALIQGGEATRHATNVLGVLATQPGIAKTPIEKVISLTGVGRIVPAIRRAFSVKDANYDRDLTSGIMNGAIRGNHFAEYGGFEDKIPVMGWLKHAVFGPGGVEARSRIAMYRLLRENDPKLGETEAWNRVNNEMGTYVATLAPKLANVAAGSGADPFARAGVGLGKAGLKTLAGIGPTGKFSLERAMIAPSSVMTWVLLHKALDEQNRWPWDAGTPFGKLPIMGQEIGFLDVLMNPVWRGMSHLGLRGAADEALRGKTAIGDLAGGAARGAANALVGRAGPIPRTAWVGATSLYWHGKGQLPIIGGPPVGYTDLEHPIQQSAKNVAKTFVPQFGDYAHAQENPELSQEGSRAKALRGLADFFGFPSRPVRNDKDRRASQQKAKEAPAYQVLDDIMYQTRAIGDPTQRMERAMGLLRERVSPEQVQMLQRQLMQRVRGAPRSTERAYQRSLEQE